jgi:hypothetical protein
MGRQDDSKIQPLMTVDVVQIRWVPSGIRQCNRSYPILEHRDNDKVTSLPCA